MIDKREILESASAFTLQPGGVEKDYVLGWLLAGIYEHPELVDSWVFKGGTCLKKCFFETRRRNPTSSCASSRSVRSRSSEKRYVMGEVVAWVADESGLVMPADQLSFDIHANPRGRLSRQGKIGYRGPVSPTSNAGGWPKIKLDLTADEQLVLPAVRREVFHPYTDRPEAGFWINSYSYEGAFGCACVRRSRGSSWSKKERLSDALLKDLVEHFSKVSLRNNNIRSDLLGDAYEYLIKKWCSDTSQDPNDNASFCT